MTLIEHMRSLDAVSLDSLAKRCDTSVGQLRQVALGFRRANPALAIKLERETKRAVICEDLRPDIDWAYLRNSSIGPEQSVA
ncbi:transcriptional regulator [Pseudomonas brassicacearum]|uniref:transcriptional regulator n=1 Tax=Pseudomonas brassicacearum TaxID=930166 RepID=UPI001BDE3490|nr:YdaS family helix-turn-helix protein [Pseudomonas brassicacearum]